VRVSAPAAASVERFRSDFEAVLGRPVTAGERIALAVSGGPDSMAMLALGHGAFPGQVVAATVDHRLRPESADEAAMVAGYCAAAGIAHQTLAVPVSPDAGDNIQSWARRERYALLRHWAAAAGAASLATAHHADDQAETFLMRAARGSGLSGLAAVRARRDIEIPGHPQGLALIRPLLGWRHRDLRAIAVAAELPFVDDPSNTDDRFDRTRFRRLLADTPWLDPIQLARSAAYLAEADADLVAVSAWLWTERRLPSEDREAKLDIAGLPRAVRRHLARMAISHVLIRDGEEDSALPHAANIEALLDALEAGRAATQAEVMASAKGDVWHFRQAPPRRSH
jgi:tRNA(Ile)-lysidine synthase